MDSSNAALAVGLDRAEVAHESSLPGPSVEDTRPAAILKGTARGLEAIVNGRATPDAIVFALIKRLDEAPGFFRGSDLRVRVEDGPLPAGCLGRLDEIATRFELRILEVVAARAAAAVESDAVPVANLAAGSAPSPATSFEDEPTQGGAVAFAETKPDAQQALTLPSEPALLDDAAILADLVEELGTTFEEPTQTAIPLSLGSSPEIELGTKTQGTRLVVGPVRSGVILEHTGHLVVFGDVNPGAEIRAEGNIIVLGRLRGTAHAGIGQDVGFILALRLEPQQLRIGRQVARAATGDTAAAESEIAYATGDKIVVERYQGRLPRDLASSI